MPPAAYEVQAVGSQPTEQVANTSSSQHQPLKPLKQSGALDAHEHFDVTPVIGREFPKANLVEWLNAPNSDALLRDLAITICERNVVFFRAQNDLTNELQKELIIRLGKLSGRPETSSLHIHPLLNNAREGGGTGKNSLV